MSKNKVLDEIKANMKKLTVIPNVMITPAIAEELLKLNVSNRILRPKAIDEYADLMKKGQWKFEGSNLCLSKTGKFQQGQHRLRAIIKTGLPQMYNIQTGLEEDAFEVMDTGRNRNGGDVLAIAGFRKSPGILSGAIKIISMYDKGYMGKSSKNIPTSKRMTNHDLVAWMESANQDRMMASVEKASKCYQKARLLAPQTYAAFIFIFSRKDETAAFDFFTKLSTGENISSTHNSSIYSLRQKLINMSGQHRKEDVLERYGLIIKAWNYFREGKEVKQFAFSPLKDEFPRAK